MIYLKSFLVGLLALVLATLIALGLVFASMVIMVRIQPPLVRHRSSVDSAVAARRRCGHDFCSRLLLGIP